MKILKPDEIRTGRLRLKMSQEKFARLMEVTQMTVYRWETGRSKPSRSFRRRMQEMFAGNV